jgi:raffinose/stachyose/melibiose transport system permease protein
LTVCRSMAANLYKTVRERRKDMVLKDRRYVFLLLSPTILLIMIFLFIPLVRTVGYSLTSWYNFSINRTFIGLGNYGQIATDPVVLIALRNTGILIVGVLIFQIGLSLILALCVDSAKHFFKFFRTVYFFPIVISATAIGLMFSLIYKYDYGLLNYILVLLGMERQVWLTQASAIYLVLIPVCWQYVGFYFVIFLTGISKIPEEIYESAVLDGVKPFQKAFYITIPLLKDILTSSLILVVSGCFKVFDMIYVITGGGPFNSSELLSTYMYRKAFMDYNIGYASAISIVMIVLGLAITGILRKVTSKIEDE